MRTRLLLVGAAVLLLALALVGGLAIARNQQSADPFYGTFINEEMSPQKWVTFPGGFKSYVLATDRLPADEATERVVERWRDPDGSRWYRTLAVMGTRRLRTLQRLSSDGLTRQFTAVDAEDPTSKSFPESFPPAGSYTWHRAGR